MVTDAISEIGIDALEKLYIKPEKQRFDFIYRSATEVHWDETGLFLYSPKPREWTYFDWYKHIIFVIESEANCKLELTQKTKWVNISEELKKEINGE